MTSKLGRRASFAIFGLALHAGLLAQADLPADRDERECWLRYTNERTTIPRLERTSVSFANLRNGYTVDSPFLVEFGVKGMGVAPAEHKLDNTGHHHILINTKLPDNPQQQIPFSETHAHFGKGQTNTVLNLKPGRHTLRLLFADEKHRPYFVYSPEIVVNVRGPRSEGQEPKINKDSFATSCQLWYEAERSRPRSKAERVVFANVRNGEAVTTPFHLQFTVDGRFVAHESIKLANTGHLIIETRQDKKVIRRTPLSNGATQAEFDLPRGNYSFTLRYVDNASGKEAIAAETIDLQVR